MHIFYHKYSKKVLIVILLFVYILVQLINTPNPEKASAITQQSKNNAYVAGLIACLNYGLDTDDDVTNYTDMFHEGGDRNLIVLGVDTVQGTGVTNCLETIDKAVPVIAGVASGDASKAWLIEQLLPSPAKTFNDLSGGKTSGSSIRTTADALINDTLIPYLNANPLSEKDLAERSLPLADYCFNFKTSPFTGPADNPDRNFDAPGKSGQIYASYTFISDDAVATDFQINKNGGVWSSTDSTLGDIVLGFRLDSNTTTNNFNGGWDSNFYALGQDYVYYPNKKGNLYGTSMYGKDVDLGILSCSWIKDNADTLFKYYSIDANGDLNIDGLTSQNVLEQGEVLISFASGGPDNPTCESQGFSMSWLFCPIINGALDSMDWLFRQFIEPFLITQPLTTQDNDYTYQIWKSFRTIGNIVLVFMLLFVVFGQAIGGGVVDAYTAKKAMPRILVAAIMINLSYFGVMFLIDMFNIIGAGVGQLITAPLQGAGSFSFTPNNFVNTSGLLAVGLGGAWLISLLGQSGFLPLLFLTVLLPMLLVVISIFGTLIVRRGLIVILAVTAPVAAALFVLPNTEKYAKQWLSLFIKTLVVYPIIMAIFGVADLLSVMLLNASSSTSGVQDSLQQFIGLIVLFVPFFMIPFAFKIAGGAIGTVSNAISTIGNKRYEKFKGNELDQNSRLHEYQEKKRGGAAIKKTARAQWLESKSSATGGPVSKAVNRFAKARNGQASIPSAPLTGGNTSPTGVGTPAAHMKRKAQYLTGTGKPLPPPTGGTLPPPAGGTAQVPVIGPQIPPGTQLITPTPPPPPAPTSPVFATPPVSTDEKPSVPPPPVDAKIPFSEPSTTWNPSDYKPPSTPKVNAPQGVNPVPSPPKRPANEPSPRQQASFSKPLEPETPKPPNDKNQNNSPDNT